MIKFSDNEKIMDSGSRLRRMMEGTQLSVYIWRHQWKWLTYPDTWKGLLGDTHILYVQRPGEHPHPKNNEHT